MKPLSIAVDVDGVVADLHVEWLRMYNEDYNDNLTIDKVTDWKMSTFVKPECGVKILDYLDRHDLYDNVPPIEGALEGINYLRELGCRISYVSSCVLDTGDDKLKWLLKHGFTTLYPGTKMCKEWIVASDKSWINADVMIDDRPENIQTFKGVGVIFDQPYNRNTLADARMKEWKEIPRIFAELYPMFNEAIYI